MEDPCSLYIRWRYHALGKLYPILDTIWYPEEVRLLPAGCTAPSLPSYFLFADDERYYVYWQQDNSLYKAGTTLDEILQGLVEGRIIGYPAKEVWETVEVPKEYDDVEFYYHFPDYNATEIRNELAWDIEVFIPPAERAIARL